MGAPRTFAARLLRAMLSLTPRERRAWVEAMLRELDFIGLDQTNGDWAALFWALGCTDAIFRECVRGWGTWLLKQCASLLGIRPIEEGDRMNSTGKKTLGVLTGIGLALGLGVAAYLLRNVIADMLLALGVPRTMWSHILSVILPTELIVVGSAILLWRRQRAAVAIGLLVPAVLMGAHVVIFLASR
jgi:hypothetical protein